MSTEIQRINDALQFIDASDRKTWVDMAMAVKSELGDEGFDVWESWSQQAASFNAKDARDVWKSASPGGGIGIGTLFYQAKQNGWQDDGKYQKPSLEELEKRRQSAVDRAKQECAEIELDRARAAAWAAEILKAASPALADHPYLARKQVSPVSALREISVDKAAEILGYAPNAKGEPLTGRLLVVPVKQGDKFSTVELIDEAGLKTALAGRGSKAGGYWATGRLPDGGGPEPLHFCEGVATTLSVKEATGEIGIATLSAGNMPTVAKIMRERYPTRPFVFCADLVKATGAPDHHAVDATRAVGGKLAIPDFGKNRETGQTDFNDMAALRGADAVRSAIAYAAPPQDCGDGVDNDWPDPVPLTAKLTPESYPTDALPDPIQAAVREVAGFVHAPLSMIAGSALSALSLAAQSHVDVRREVKLEGPSGLFLLTIADSGERKSTCDKFFTTVIQEYEAEQAEIAKPLIQDYRASMEAWEAKKAGVKERIRQEAKAGKPTAIHEQALRELEYEKPEAPKVPRLLYADATPEALTHGLAKDWPAGGVVSAEAGIVFGSHGMGKESVMRNLATLNQLWDGTSLDIRRKSSESFVVQGARLTVALQIQEVTLRDFFSKSGALARGTGFMARFLIAWPESTQGSRLFTAAPTSWPALSAYHRRIAAILNQPAPIDETGGLQPSMLTFTPEARHAWIAFHDAIESSLGAGGELYDVRDVASKTADNAARIAGLFHAYEHGTGGAISLESFQCAARIAAWHLSEARRFFGELALPVELADAARLDTWLIEHCRKMQSNTIGKNHARQHGPLRDGQRLDAAIRELGELDRLRMEKAGKRLTIHVNPALVEATP